MKSPKINTKNEGIYKVGQIKLKALMEVKSHASMFFGLSWFFINKTHHYFYNLIIHYVV